MVLTRIWPTRRRPSMGSFVRDRVRGVPDVRVVKPRWAHAPWPLLYATLFVDALRMTGPIRGVEAHVVAPTGLVGLAVARLRRVPLVVYAHGTDVREASNRGPAYRWLARWVIEHADAVVTNSTDTAAHVRRLGRDPIIASPGVPLETWKPTPRHVPRRVLYVGGRSHSKGYEVADEFADTLVGPGLREIPPHEMPSLLASHDVLLMPSSDEGFGLAAVEAIASGRWVVASDVGGLRDIVIDGVNGTLVADGDFAAALARVPDYDPEVVAATAERHSLQRWQAAMNRVWEDVLAAKSPDRGAA